MPFSFKPDVIPGNIQTTEQATPSANLGGSMPSSEDRPKGEGKSIVEVFLFIIFGCMVFIAVVLFGYKYYLSSQVDAKKATLADYESQLSGLPLDDMRKLSNRVKVINQLVKEHPSVNVAFLIVEASVENAITFTRFDLRYSDNTKDYKLVLAGVSPDYKSIAQQLDTYSRKPYNSYVSDVAVEGLSPDETGKITFNFTMPVSIMGILPETFSVLDQSSTGNASTTADTSVISATTTPIMGAPVASGTPQAMKP